LSPLFAQLADAGSDGVKAQGVLALAELVGQHWDGGPGAAPGPAAAGVDLLLVRRLQPAVQAVVLGEAVRGGLLGKEQLKDLVGWPDLDPSLYIAAAARLVEAGESFDAARLCGMAEGPVPETSALAATLLLGCKLDAAERSRWGVVLDQRLGNAPEKGGVGPMSNERLAQYLGVLRARPIRAVSGAVAAAATRFADDRLMAFEFAATLGVLDPESPGALAAWKAAAAACGDRGDRLRLAMSVLDAARRGGDENSPAGEGAVAWLLADEDAAVRSIGTALERVRAGCGTATEAVVAMMETCGTPALWPALQLAEARACLDATRVRLAVLEGVCRAAEPSAQAEEHALNAAAALAATDPLALRGWLEETARSGRGRCVQRGLEGALRAHATVAAAVVEVKGDGDGNASREGAAGVAGAAFAWPDERSAALAELLKARHAAALADEQAERLSRIALGEGRLSDALRVQAAWVVLRARKQDRAALAQVMADVMP
jgi:hypothetical protein